MARGRPKKVSIEDKIRSVKELLGTELMQSRLKSQREQRLDARWQNEATGLGTDIDPKTHMKASAFWTPINWSTLGALYADDPLVAKICDLEPNEALKNGFETPCDDLLSTVRFEGNGLDLEQRVNNRGVQGAIEEVLKWSNVYGGACIVTFVDDGRPMWEPQGKGELTDLCVFHPPYCLPQWVGDARSRMIRISTVRGQQLMVDCSRIVMVVGDPAPMEARQKLQGFGISKIQRLYDSLKSYYTVEGASDRLVAEASVGVFAMAGLIDSVTSASGALFESRMELFNTYRSVYGTMVIDAGDEQGNFKEEYTRINAQLSGLAELLEKRQQGVSAAANVSMIKLFGLSPGGLGSNGESETRDWYSQVGTYQLNKVAPIIAAICSVASGKNIIAKDIKFPNLWEPTAKEQGELNLNKANEEATLVGCGIKTPNEIRAERGLPPLDAKEQAEVVNLINSILGQTPNESLPQTAST
jgi:phage-related protein (TIGR01555 family)